MNGRSPATIIVINDFAYVQGGASKIAINEALELSAAGLRVILFSAVGPVSPQLAASWVEVICLDQPQLLDVKKNPLVSLQGMWNQRANHAMSNLLSSLDPAQTILHLHGWTKALSASPVAAAASAGFSIVCTLHDFFTACPNGAFFDYVKTAPCPRKALSVDCITAQCDKRRRVHKAFRVARQFVWKRVGHLPSAVAAYITLSNRSEAILKPYLPADARFFQVRHEIDMEQRPAAQVAANVAIVCVGRLDEEKGVRLLANAAGQIGASVVFVGDGPLKDELTAMPGVTVTGWLPASEVVAWLDRARFVVFPSLWYETFGLVVEEAAARGVAAVVSDVSAPSERIKDGINGWLFSNGNQTSLEAALGRALAGNNAVRIGMACYHRYWDEHARQASHVEMLMLVYEAVLDSRTRPFSEEEVSVAATASGGG